MRLSINTAYLSGILEDKLAAVAAARFHGVELAQSDLVTASWTPAQIRQECARRGLSIELYQASRDIEAVPPQQFAATLRWARRSFDVLAHLGATTMLIGSSASPDTVDDDDLAAEQLAALADEAAGYGLRLAYEPLSSARFVTSYAHAWRIVRRAGHAALGLCLDSFHVLSHGDDPAGIRVIPGDKIFHVQLADATAGRRILPGLGSFDLATFLVHVLTTGYHGPLSLDAVDDVYRQEAPRQAAINGMRSLLAVREAAAAAALPQLRETIQVSGLPPAPPLAGYAFTEIAVDEISEPHLARALAGLGFAHTGRHRSKPVQLWEQGEARILLNTGSQRTVTPGTAGICAMAVVSADPATAGRRAESLLAPVLPRLRLPEEAALPSIAAPDGTAVFLVGDQGWLTDFTPTGTPAPAGDAITTIDHLALTTPIDDFDESALFHQTVLGLRAAGTTEIAAPFGTIRARAATDPGHTVTVVLNTAPLRHGEWAPAVADPQYIALGTDDIIACARAAHARGAPLLHIADNYYAELDARVTLPPGLLDQLREHSILYDTDDRGAYLHFYTEILGSRVFFAVVQRLDGYTGHGGPVSAPVRMAAHRHSRLHRLRETPATRHDFSLAHLTALSLSPPELVDAAAEAGYRYVGLRLTRVTPQEPHYPLATDPALLRATKVHLAATGVEVLDIELARISPTENPDDFQRFLETGAELGARHVITQLPDPDHHRRTDRFARLCELARPLGLTVDLEFPSWTETPDLHTAVRVLRGADQPNAGILVDLLHFARSGSSIAELRQLPREWFHFAHVCDAPPGVPATNEELIHTARFERLFPGEGGIDIHGILDALPAGIPYALEIPRATLVAQVGGKEHARLAIAAARAALDHASTQAHGA
ncbi:TIM barrel protein [Actinoplanes sp. NPDC051494]|uniref:TIM barrel protein n=1 Tax=Actinoplanes sp. NPDC051494 TaxID=3363907 RepID=UPI0037A60C20